MGETVKAKDASFISSSFLRGASHIDFCYEKRHCDACGGELSHDVSKRNIDNYSKSYTKNIKPVNIAQVLILNSYINFFAKKHTEFLFLSSGPAEPVRLVRPWPDQLLNSVAFFFNLKKIVTFLKSTMYTIIRQISSNRKIATDCDSGIQPTHLGYNNC